MGLLDGDELVAEAHALPVAWDGTPEDLPSGWDEAFVRGMTSDREATVLSALAISVSPTQQGRQLSSRMIQSFKDNAREAGLSAVIAPVRPTWKERYPLIRSSDTWLGAARTARTSTPGSGSTSAWAARSSRRRHDRW